MYIAVICILPKKFNFQPTAENIRMRNSRELKMSTSGATCQEVLKFNSKFLYFKAYDYNL